MSKKTIIATAIIVILAIIIIVVLFFQSTKKAQIQEQIQTMEQAIESSSADPCADITVQSEFVSQDACYNYIAQTTNDKALCDKIKQQELKDNCYENVE